MGTLDAWLDRLPDPPVVRESKVLTDADGLIFAMPSNWHRKAGGLVIFLLPVALALMACTRALLDGAADRGELISAGLTAIFGGVGALPEVVKRVPPTVHVDSDGLEITRKCLWPFQVSIPKEDIGFVHVARPQAYLGGRMRDKESAEDYLQSGRDDSRVIVAAGNTLFTFGEKLPRNEKEWIAGCICRILWPDGAPDPELRVPRPHERLPRWALQCAIVIAALFVLIGLVVWFGRDFGGLLQMGGVIALLAGVIGSGLIIRYLGKARRFSAHEQALRDLAGRLEMTHTPNDTAKGRFGDALPRLPFLHANARLCNILTHWSKPEAPIAFNYARGPRLFKPYHVLWHRMKSRPAPKVKPAELSFACVLELPATGVTQVDVGPRALSYRLLRGLAGWLAPGRSPAFSQSYKVNVQQNERSQVRRLFPPDLQRELAHWAVHDHVPEVHILPEAIAFNVSRADLLSGKEKVHDFLRRAVRCRQAIAEALGVADDPTAEEGPQWLAEASVSASN
jgi:hypothetical protein